MLSITRRANSSLDDIADGAEGNAVLLAELGVRGSTGCVCGSDGCYLDGSEFANDAPFESAVSGIVCIRSHKQVCGCQEVVP